MTPKPFLTPAELAARWGGRMTTATLNQWRYLGRGPRYVKLGQSVVYSLEAIEQYEAEQTRTPGEPV